ncbi:MULTISPECIES: hypothetical protein [unclassified Streptomyces]|uniref:hypothetical protein n=1 Tax=unclassified Streptomyces TaxID=2593676 RepID=UPI0035DD6F04
MTTLLAQTFPEYVPGVQHGFRVQSLDHQEPRRMYVRWHRVTPLNELAGPPLGIEEVLAEAGYAVTTVPGRWDVVYVDDRPVDTSGPRYAAVANDIPLTAPWLVMDQWTRVHAATAETEDEAAAEAMRLDRRHMLADARRVVVPELLPFLERADQLLGDGMRWIYQEVHQGNGPYVEHERIDALVHVANALLVGRDVAQYGRMLAYSAPLRAAAPGEYSVRWVPKSSKPAVGYFPGPGWQRGPQEDVVIRLLIDAGLSPVVYGESVGEGGFMCESDGFMVSAASPFDLTVRGINVDEIGLTNSQVTEQVRVALEAAGWDVTGDDSWPGAWTVLPPAE